MMVQSGASAEEEVKSKLFSTKLTAQWYQYSTGTERLSYQYSWYHYVT